RPSSSTCSSMSTTTTRSNSASAKGRRSPSVCWTSVPTRPRMEATASAVRSAEAQRPPARRRSRLTTPLSEPRSRQRRPSVGPKAAAISAYLRCLRTERRKRASAHGSAAGTSDASTSATALRPQDDRRSHQLAQAEEGRGAFGQPRKTRDPDRAMKGHGHHELGLARRRLEAGGHERAAHVRVAEDEEGPRVPLHP